MKDILDDILSNKYREVEVRKAEIPLERLVDTLPLERKKRSMRAALAASPTGIISEFKRCSPSKGWINQDAEIVVVTAGYAITGASALSVLTDNRFFGGSLDDLRQARTMVDIPILRKDFIVDEYQLYEAAHAGADAVLLIAAALTPGKCAMLAEKAHAIGLEVLLEIHSANELAYITENIDMVGVNNRNLGTFHTDVRNSFDLAALLPAGHLLVSESGISDPSTVKALRHAGFRGFLIGETFMKTASPAQALADFIALLA